MPHANVKTAAMEEAGRSRILSSFIAPSSQKCRSALDLKTFGKYENSGDGVYKVLVGVDEAGEVFACAPLQVYL